MDKSRAKGCRIVSTIAALLASCVAVFGTQSVTLGWSPGSGGTAAGYNIYWGTASGVYPNKISVGTNTSFTLSGLTAGATYYISATAYDSNGNESSLAPEIAYVAPGVVTLSTSTVNGVRSAAIRFPAAPTQQYTIQTSRDLVHWTNLWVSPVASTNGWIEFDDPLTNSVPTKFYRLLL